VPPSPPRTSFSYTAGYDSSTDALPRYESATALLIAGSETPVHHKLYPMPPLHRVRSSPSPRTSRYPRRPMELRAPAVYEALQLDTDRKLSQRVSDPPLPGLQMAVSSDTVQLGQRSDDQVPLLPISIASRRDTSDISKQNPSQQDSIVLKVEFSTDARSSNNTDTDGPPSPSERFPYTMSGSQPISRVQSAGAPSSQSGSLRILPSSSSSVKNTKSKNINPLRRILSGGPSCASGCLKPPDENGIGPAIYTSAITSSSIPVKGSKLDNALTRILSGGSTRSSRRLEPLHEHVIATATYTLVSPATRAIAVGGTDCASQQEEEVLADDQEPSRKATILYRSLCQSPPWLSGLKRYEHPIHIVDPEAPGQVLWEATTTTFGSSQASAFSPGRERQRGEGWVLHHLQSGERSAVGPLNLDLNMWTASVDGRTYLVRCDGSDLHLGTLQQGRVKPFAFFNGSQQTVHITLRLKDSSRQESVAQAVDLAFVICFFEAVQAIRVELSVSGGRNRCDDSRRLMSKSRGLKQLFEPRLGV